MSNLLTNKTLHGAAVQYMRIVEATQGNGLRKELLVKAVQTVLETEAKELKELLAGTVEVLEADKRYNRNILAFLRACSSYPTRAKERLEGITATAKMDDILTIGRGLKKSDDAIEAEATAEVDTAEATAEVDTAEATAEVAEAVTAEREARPNVVSVAQTLATLKDNELSDMLYSETDTLDTLVQNFTGTKEQTAVLIAKIGEAIAYAESVTSK